MSEARMSKASLHSWNVVALVGLFVVILYPNWCTTPHVPDFMIPGWWNDNSAMSWFLHFATALPFGMLLRKLRDEDERS